ncbi:MAG: FHA domain-containing protein [Chloroflexaceae bacterium]|nr:FHA domain-containing protein [Chloroflexaceae bacterium]
MAKAIILTAISGVQAGARHTFVQRTIVVGTDFGVDLFLEDRNVVKRHAEVKQALAHWFVTPLQSNAVVFVNSKVIEGQTRINDGDLVTFGSTTFRVAMTVVADPPRERAVGKADDSSSQNGVPRLGEYLVRRGVVSQMQITEALQRQNDLQRQGRRIHLGDLLYEMGHITRLQLEYALQEQRNDFFTRFHD